MKPTDHKLEDMQGIQLHEEITTTEYYSEDKYEIGGMFQYRTENYNGKLTSVERSIKILFNDNTRSRCFTSYLKDDDEALSKYNELINYLGVTSLPIWHTEFAVKI